MSNIVTYNNELNTLLLHDQETLLEATATMHKHKSICNKNICNFVNSDCELQTEGRGSQLTQRYERKIIISS